MIKNDEIREYENRLYKAVYAEHDENKCVEVWNEIKENKELLTSAIQVKKNKWEEDVVTSHIICRHMLISNDVDKDIYQKLVDVIYSNEQLARCHLYIDPDLYGRQTYLSKVICDYDLELTEEQKRFAEKEAKSEHNFHDCYLKRNILMNPNWAIEEKANLIYEFYTDETWDEELENMEWDIVNDSVNYRGEPFSFMDKTELYQYRYEDLFKVYQSEETTERIWEDISLCRLFHQIRPQQWELKEMSQLNGDTSKIYAKK